MRPRSLTLTPKELAIMKVMWRLEQGTVRDVYECLREKREIAYTTVMTMMGILEEKGYLKRMRVDRPFVYKPAHSREHVIAGMVRDFVDRVFDGAASTLLVHLTQQERMTKADRERIRQLIAETEE